LQNYADKNFVDALAFCHELSQAKDIQDFVGINVEFARRNLQSVVEQAKDFAEACSAWQRTLLRQLPFCSF
jgi:hypothetical protein